MKAYRIVNREDSRSLAEYLTENGQLLLPMVELIEALPDGHRRADRRVGPGQHRGRVGLSARGVAGEKQRGRKKEAVRWFRLAAEQGLAEGASKRVLPPNRQLPESGQTYECRRRQCQARTVAFAERDELGRLRR